MATPSTKVEDVELEMKQVAEPSESAGADAGTKEVEETEVYLYIDLYICVYVNDVNCVAMCVCICLMRVYGRYAFIMACVDRGIGRRVFLNLIIYAVLAILYCSMRLYIFLC